MQLPCSLVYDALGVDGLFLFPSLTHKHTHTHLRNNKMPQWVKAFAVRPGKLSLIPET